jgi:signal transduction histidine kinase
VGSELTRSTPGTGIGLALVKELANMMQADVDVCNHQPGAEFRLMFRPVQI